MTTERYEIQTWNAGQWYEYYRVDTEMLGKIHLAAFREQYPFDKYRLVKTTTEVLA